jgi:hypothetical protein
VPDEPELLRIARGAQKRSLKECSA